MSEPLRALLIEDCSADAELLLHALKDSGFQVASQRVQTESELKSTLESSEWDVVLADFSLPQFSAMAALMIVREKDLDLPFIVVSGEVGEATAVEAMRAGAHDFVGKDNLGRLSEVVRREVEGARERRDWRQTADKTPAQDARAPIAPSRWEWFGPLALATSLTLVVTVGVELLQEYFFPALSTWVASILVVAVAGPVAAISIYYLLARRRALMQRMLEEFMEHRRLNEMRRRLAERTRELEANIRERQRRERHLQAQHAITRVMAGSRPLEDAIQAMLHSIREHLGWDSSQFWALDTKTSRLKRTSTHYTPSASHLAHQAPPTASTERLCERVWAGGKPLWLPELREEEPQISNLARFDHGYRSALAFPVRLGHEVLGVMAFLSAEPKPVDRELLQLLDDIGNQIGQFMERLRAESALQKAHEELESRVRRRTAELASLNEALTRSETNLRQAQQIARLGSFEVHTPFTVNHGNFWSQEARRILGIDSPSTDLPLDQFIQGWINPEDRQRVQQALETSTPDEHDFELECKITRPDNEIRFLRILGHASKDPTNHVLKLVGTLQDITERKQLEQQVLEISENEQRRIGQDLHDDLCQHLAGIEFMSQALQHRLEDHDHHHEKSDAELAQRVAQLVRDAINQTRGLARGLSPVQLESRGLRAALEDLAGQVERMFHVRCQLAADPNFEVRNITVATHVYRIAQEAITNAVRHGKADRIEIELHGEEQMASLRVGDNGLGIPNHSMVASQGMGLRIMHYRAGMIGASLQVKPGLQKGTLVECTFPIAV